MLIKVLIKTAAHIIIYIYSSFPSWFSFCPGRWSACATFARDRLKFPYSPSLEKCPFGVKLLEPARRWEGAAGRLSGGPRETSDSGGTFAYTVDGGHNNKAPSHALSALHLNDIRPWTCVLHVWGEKIKA